MKQLFTVRDDEIGLNEWIREVRIWWLTKLGDRNLRNLRAMDWARHRGAAERLRMKRRPAMVACLNEWNNVRGCR